ncbi:unnamed protein product, partial [Brassica napus]
EGKSKGVPNERRRQSLRIQKPDSIAKRPEPRVHKSSKKSKKSKKSRPVREPVRAQSVESLSASDESEREGKKVAEEEKKEEEAVKVVEEQAGEVVEEQVGEIVEEYTEEEKQRLIMVVYKEAPSPWIMHRCKENAAVAVPKKSGRPKRKSQWVQTPFTEGKKRKTKP